MLYLKALTLSYFELSSNKLFTDSALDCNERNINYTSENQSSHDND